VSEEISTVADSYIDKFIATELTLIKITDEKFTLLEMRKALINRISERDLNKIMAYTFMGALYLEKI
jgi:hypothetical protein